MTKQRVAQINAALGEHLHRELWRRKVSQATIAKALGVTQGAVSRRLRGEAKIEAAELLIIAELLEVSPMQLLFPQQEFLVGTLEEHQARTGAMPGEVRTLLPRLDSNQQPCDYPLVLVRGGVESPEPHDAQIYHLADYRSEPVPA